MIHIIKEFVENDFNTDFADVHKGMASAKLSAPLGFSVKRTETGTRRSLIILLTWLAPRKTTARGSEEIMSPEGLPQNLSRTTIMEADFL